MWSAKYPKDTFKQQSPIAHTNSHFVMTNNSSSMASNRSKLLMELSINLLEAMEVLFLVIWYPNLARMKFGHSSTNLFLGVPAQIDLGAVTHTDQGAHLLLAAHVAQRSWSSHGSWSSTGGWRWLIQIVFFASWTTILRAPLMQPWFWCTKLQ